MKNIVISNQEKLEKLKKKISEAGVEKFHILTDFDRTLTYVFVNREVVKGFIWPMKILLFQSLLF